MVEESGDLACGVEPGDGHAGGGDDAGVGVGAEAAVGEADRGGERDADERSGVERGCPVGFGWLEADGGFAVEAGVVELAGADGGVELGDGLLQCFRLQAEFARELGEGVGLLGRDVGEPGVGDVGDVEAGGVGDPVRLLVLVAPDLVADEFEGVVPGVLALVEEPRPLPLTKMPPV